MSTESSNVLMTEKKNSPAIGFSRRITDGENNPFDGVVWGNRDAVIQNWTDGSIAFEQKDVEFPESWSINASNIVSQKYFRGAIESEEREASLKSLVGRVVGQIVEWGEDEGYFASGNERDVFHDELIALLIRQKASFNSPVWFNIGVPETPQQSSACFILAVDDTIDSILNWYVDEGKIFKGGSGSGANLSRIRASVEEISGGGTPSGPVSFMRGADASAGTIKSGGKTRRAAKMVMLDIDHPDIDQFIWSKSWEEKKERVLREAGFDVGIDGEDLFSLQYQNANNSVRVSDEFMEAVEKDLDWELTARTTGETIKSVKAQDLFAQISRAAWECADPGIQFDTTINRWHTTPVSGRINGSNPCSEYVHLDNSACNLSSLNLLSFLDVDGTFDVDGFRHAVRVMITAQEILVTPSHYPTESIGENARNFRQLGLGYTNLGALLMALGLPYDSDDARSLAAVITAVMTGEAYRTSAQIAARMGAFGAYELNREATLSVLEAHRKSIDDINVSEAVPASLLAAAVEVWGNAIRFAEQNGVRNAQVTVLAPTGTISFMMDCDTTGVEPDLGLKKTKTLVGGGTITTVNQTIPRALEKLGYDAIQREEIIEWIEKFGSIIKAPHLKEEHLSVFACSMGDNFIEPFGHIQMMSAVQPFLSGAISKTVNLPQSATVEDVQNLYLEAWKVGLKAVAIYRDNCKVAQPLSVDGQAKDSLIADAAKTLLSEVTRPQRERLPRSRSSKTFEFRVADCKGFVTVGEYSDGRPGEIFIRVSKQGSTLAGIMDAFAMAVSHGLQYGVPIEAYVSAFVGMRFDPAGITDDPELRIASSLIDYLFRRLAVEYLSLSRRSSLNIYTSGERTQPTLPGIEEAAMISAQEVDILPDPPSAHMVAEKIQIDYDAPFCMQCGTGMQRSGSCFTCQSCGTTSGCS
ncbi:MAG: vitamin B12-dependent ribonucleotide reductase [Actinomycetota bacterium]